MFGKTPLAWLQLIKTKSRLAVALAGIGFADMLMFVQLGMLDALLTGATQAHHNLQADLVLTNPQFQTLFNIKNFPRERLQQTLAYDGVKSVRSPLANFALLTPLTYFNLFITLAIAALPKLCETQRKLLFRYKTFFSFK